MKKTLNRIPARVGSLAASASVVAALLVASLVITASASAYEGFGYQTKGGSGGSTCHVTNLASFGSGSLYDCVVNRVGARIVVFDVAGTITPDDTLYVRDPYLTVDGGTAPAPGITVRPPTNGLSAFVVDNTHDVIIRGLRVVGYNPSGSAENPADLIALDGDVYNVVIDHMSLTAADDGALDITGNVHDVTVSWCLFYGNGLTSLIKYDTRQRISIHHNVYAHNAERNPQVKGDMRTLDFRNNIVYDWHLLSYGYGLRLWSAPSTADSPGIPSVNVVGNAFIAKNTSDGCGIELIEDSTPVQRFVSDNFASPSPLCLSSNLSAPLSIPTAAQVTTSPSSALGSVVLPTVGLTPHNSTEQALLDAIAARLPASSSYTLSVTGSGTGSGVVTSSPGGISCGSACSAPYASGTVVTLTATPASGSTFAGWSGACTGTAACTLTMNAAANVAASFSATAPGSYTLNVAKAGSGSGTVSSSPAGISCGSTCSTSYGSGTVVTLTAVAASGSTFAGWAGACSGTSSCTVTMNGAASVSAAFNTTAPSSSAYEGFGSQTLGGQGGSICHVTNLAKTGAGSLLDCALNRSGPRTVVFDVAGTITTGGDMWIQQPYLTIDGSTAPSPGITIRSWDTAPGGPGTSAGIAVINTHDVIIRGLRVVGYNTGGKADCITLDSDGGEIYNVVIDHVSLTAADDGALDITGNVHDVTVSWSLFYGNDLASLFKYDSRQRFSIHHNVWANNNERNPQIKGDISPVDFRNNVVYNWGLYGLRLWSGNSSSDSPGEPYVNVVGNAFIPTHAGDPYNGIELIEDTGTVAHRYLFDNWTDTNLGAAPFPTSNIPEIAIPATARVTTSPSSALASVVLPSVGLLPHNATEQALLDAIAARLSGAPATYTLGVSKAGSGSGTVTSSPSGINCGSTCSVSYASGALVTLTAAASSGSTFAGWSGACTGTGGCAVTMSAARSVTASFNLAAPSSYSLLVTKGGSGGGTVSSSPAGISCGSACSASYTSGSVVTLTATPAAGSTFAGWSGACSGTGTCSVTMNGASSVTATFNTSTVVSYLLSVSKSGNGSGTVSSSPAVGISCGSACSWSYPAGTVITLGSAAALHSTFTGWSGACSGTGSCTLTIGAATNVVATFSRKGQKH